MGPQEFTTWTPSGVEVRVLNSRGRGGWGPYVTTGYFTLRGQRTHATVPTSGHHEEAAALVTLLEMIEAAHKAEDSAT